MGLRDDPHDILHAREPPLSYRPRAGTRLRFHTDGKNGPAAGFKSAALLENFRSPARLALWETPSDLSVAFPLSDAEASVRGTVGTHGVLTALASARMPSPAGGCLAQCQSGDGRRPRILRTAPRNVLARRTLLPETASPLQPPGCARDAACSAYGCARRPECLSTTPHCRTQRSASTKTTKRKR